jgi:hypothetical protein
VTTALIGAETVLLVLLLVLVAGLLRSHAEILRRLGPPGEDGDQLSGDRGAPARLPGAPARLPGATARLPGAPARLPGATAPEIAGATPSGDLVRLSFGGGGVPTLIAFLSSGCASCAGFWSELGRGALPGGAQPVIVTRSADRESPSRLRSLARTAIPVVLSSQAWEDYRVPGSPYFVLVDREVRGEGVATSWDALAGLLADAVADSAAGGGAGAAGGGDGAAVGGDGAAGDRIEQRLAAAGVLPGDPTLYPGRSKSG